MANNTCIAAIDDDSGVCAALSCLRRLAHFQPVSDLSAEAFLADHKRSRFDCLVLDVRMGGISGIELFAQLAADPNHPPVIFIAALDEPAVHAQAEALGCAGFFRNSTPGAAIIAAIKPAARDGKVLRPPRDAQD